MKGLVIYAGLFPDHAYEVHDFYEDPLFLRLSEAVGGRIEIVHPVGLPDPYVMIVNEDGLIRGHNFNQIASVLYGTQDHGHPVVGNVVIMKEGFVDGEPDIVGLDPEDILVVAGIILVRLCRNLCDQLTKENEEDQQ